MSSSTYDSQQITFHDQNVFRKMFRFMELKELLFLDKISLNINFPDTTSWIVDLIIHEDRDIKMYYVFLDEKECLKFISYFVGLKNVTIENINKSVALSKLNTVKENYHRVIEESLPRLENTKTIEDF